MPEVTAPDATASAAPWASRVECRRATRSLPPPAARCARSCPRPCAPDRCRRPRSEAPQPIPPRPSTPRRASSARSRRARRATQRRQPRSRLRTKRPARSARPRAIPRRIVACTVPEQDQRSDARSQQRIGEREGDRVSNRTSAATQSRARRCTRGGQCTRERQKDDRAGQEPQRRSSQRRSAHARCAARQSSELPANATIARYFASGRASGLVPRYAERSASSRRRDGDVPSVAARAPERSRFGRRETSRARSVPISIAVMLPPNAASSGRVSRSRTLSVFGSIFTTRELRAFDP